MGLVSKFMGNDKDNSDPVIPTPSLDALAGGAIDTLSNVMYVMGQESFPLENEHDQSAFPDICKDFARHVENGAAIPSYDIPRSVDGSRQWSHVRRFFADRRQAEKAFVTERLQGYRGIVDDLVSGLRDIGVQNQTTEDDVLGSLSMVEEAVKTGLLPNVKEALSDTLSRVNKTFAEQKLNYEKQLKELNDRMSSMREDLVQAREEMKRDPLTEAFNRGAFDAAILQSLNMHFILRVPVTILMIDLDDFKAINDTHGHAAGDEVLRSVSECLARTFIRKNDIVARYGGDEFAVILSDTSAAQSAPLIDRFLEHVRNITIVQTDEDHEVRCSVGYTEVADDDTVEDLMTRADRALYAAKSAGRDRKVFLAPADLEQGSND
jgi:diguanylate cyclase